MCVKDSHLTETPATETMEEGGGTASGGPRRKWRRPKGVTANSLSDLLLRLHTFARDQAQLAKESDMSSYELHASFLFELAELLQEEYDKRHGK